MTAPRILVKTEGPSRADMAPAPEAGWYLLGGLGLVFAIVAGADLALAWYPAAFGSREWEFGTVSAVLDGLPLFAMGLALSFGAAVARGKIGLLKFWSIVLIVAAVVILGLLGLYARTIPVALASTTDALVKVGLQKAIAKALLQGVGYTAAFLWTGILGWKHAKSA